MTEPLTLEGLKLGTLRVVDLKDALKERNLPTDGKKAVLLERLTAAMQSKTQANSTTVAGNESNAVQPDAMDEEEQHNQEDGAEREQGFGETEEEEGDAMPVTLGVIVTETLGWDATEQVAPAAGSKLLDSVGAAAVAAAAVAFAGEESAATASGNSDGKEREAGGGAKEDDSEALAAFVASMENDKGGGGGGAGVATTASESANGGAAEEATAGLAAAAAALTVSSTAVVEQGIREPAAAAAGAVVVGEEVDDTSIAAMDTEAVAAAADDHRAFAENITSESADTANTSAATAAGCAAEPLVVPAPVAPVPAPGTVASQDTYAYEEEQERLAMLKSLHQPMRRWYNEDYATNRARFGNFPMFWQDLASWPAMREAKKMYLIYTERRENPEQAAANDAAAAAEAEAAAVAAAVAADSASSDNPQEASSTAATGEPGTDSGGDAVTAALGEGTGSEGGEGEDGGKKKKRKKRWGDARKSRFADNEGDDTEVTQPANKRKSRWSADDTTAAPNALAATTKGAIPGMPVDLSQEQIQETLVLRMRLQQCNEKLATVDQDALLKGQDPDRSPSPPPRYDGMGVRTNTRDVRMREALNKERTKVIEEMMKLNPMFTPPPDFVKSKPHRKLYIPTDEYPGYNFIGLIIGPRGNTQKRMERETDCKIAIRGKGSVKEGARRGPTAVDADDELHVYISGESEEAVEKAAIEVGKLLRPLDDEQNEHKQKQLRELALINGTLREEDYCNICGEKGHRQFECPKRAQTRSATVEVRCALCGDTSHPTRDCLLHKAQQKTGQPGHEASLDKEYLSFMAELGDGDGAAGGAGAPQLGPRPSASTPTAVGSSASTSGGGGVGGGGVSAAASSTPAPITNHYVWTPPKPAVRLVPPAVAPARPPVLPGHHGTGYGAPPAAPSGSGTGTNSSVPYAQSTHPRPMGVQKSPFSRGGTPGVGASGAPLLPPPERPPVPPTPPSAPHGSGFLPPPLPPPQPPATTSSAQASSTSSSAAAASPSPRPASPPHAPTPVAPPGGSYGYVPPPLPPTAVYGQPNQYQQSMPPVPPVPPAPLVPPVQPVPSAYGYAGHPPQPPVPPPTWGAVAPPPPQPPLPPASPAATGYAQPPLPPAPPGAPPAWPPGFSQSGYAPPPLPPSGSAAIQSNGQSDQNTNGSNFQFGAGSPPLPPPPLPGQPPLPPG